MQAIARKWLVILLVFLLGCGHQGSLSVKITSVTADDYRVQEPVCFIPPLDGTLLERSTFRQHVSTCRREAIFAHVRVVKPGSECVTAVRLNFNVHAVGARVEGTTDCVRVFGVTHCGSTARRVSSYSKDLELQFFMRPADPVEVHVITASLHSGRADFTLRTTKYLCYAAFRDFAQDRMGKVYTFYPF